MLQKIQRHALHKRWARILRDPLGGSSHGLLGLCRGCRTSLIQRRTASSRGPGPGFVSIVDNPPIPVRTGQKHGPGLIILALIPVTAFMLGTWQVKRLEWKTNLIAKYEDRLARDPLPLPPQVDENAISEFDYRKVYAKGRFRHDQEMLLGPRIHDGENGYQVVTPLDRGDNASSVLVNRGWIPKALKNHAARPEGLPTGEVMVEGLLREPWKKNMFTPDNRPERGEFFFPDVKQMAELTGCQPVWVEETMEPDLVKIYDRRAKGIPIGRPAEVNLRNNHLQYVFTWYALSAATTYMFWLIIRKPPPDVLRRVRQNKAWA